jgi:hypothetical protein
MVEAAADPTCLCPRNGFKAFIEAALSEEAELSRRTQ